jgi:hypothetical protein
MFEKPVLEVENGPAYEVVHAAIQAAFAPAAADRFLKRVASERLRVRDFESILNRALLGQDAVAAYSKLGNLDRGQIREQYLRAVEQVAPELRARHLKVYAYY